ncbi:hypothetical protein LEP1GSC137_1035 [Leptospira borgpetersenii str. Noumea 25]|nr:hypothetical protein LEP1GSC137_1035 [Leptospira borgpetersenii str. Noumea 25]KGE26328.1 hypothetical protein IQ66_01185 [Leptospira borgpetersenii serovar Ballum]
MLNSSSLLLALGQFNVSLLFALDGIWEGRSIMFKVSREIRSAESEVYFCMEGMSSYKNRVKDFRL